MQNCLEPSHRPRRLTRHKKYAGCIAAQICFQIRAFTRALSGHSVGLPLCPEDTRDGAYGVFADEAGSLVGIEDRHILWRFLAEMNTEAVGRGARRFTEVRGIWGPIAQKAAPKNDL